MESCGEGSNDLYVATRFRDGLMIALLISCPVRLKNLTMIAIGRHLVAEDNGYVLRFDQEETKTGRPYVAGLPRELTPYVDLYLRKHRPTLMASPSQWKDERNAGDALWLSFLGRPLTSSGVQKQIAWHTEKAFGAAIWPHLFRDCAVTELVDLAPQEIGIASDLLGHGSLRTTRKHYIQATGMKAHRVVQDKLTQMRNAARLRRREN